MNLQAAKETFYRTDFNQSIETGLQPDWLRSLRRDAFQYFTENGFPTVRNEEWKYTDVKAIAGRRWEVSGPEAPRPASLDGLDRALTEAESGNRIVLVDGVFDAELSKVAELPSGARILSFREAFDDDVFRDHLAQIVKFGFNGFTALNTAFLGEGVFIHLPRKAIVRSPIFLNFIATSEVAAFPRVLIAAESLSQATIVESYSRTADAANLTNAVVEISVGDEARLKHFRVQRESAGAFHVGTTKAKLGRAALYDSTNINLGGKLSRHDVGVEFLSEGGEAFVDGLYMLSGDQHSDTHSLIEHNLPNCVSHQNYKGVLNDKARAVFNGKVFVAEGARGTDAFQSNKNLLLSNDARVDTKPQLEIYNDDVKCAHGATVGQLEDEELFYLLSRGLNETLARNLLTYGFAEEVINKIEIESIKRDLDEAVLSRLHAELEA